MKHCCVPRRHNTKSEQTALSLSLETLSRSDFVLSAHNWTENSPRALVGLYLPLAHVSVILCHFDKYEKLFARDYIVMGFLKQPLVLTVSYDRRESWNCRHVTASGENVFVTFNPSILREVQPGSSSPVSEQTYFTGRKSKVLRKFISPRSNATDSVLSAISFITSYKIKISLAN